MGPPGWMERWLRARLPADFEEAIAGDLAEEYVERAGRSRIGARFWYLGQILSIDAPGLRQAAGGLNGSWARDAGARGSKNWTREGWMKMWMQDVRYAVRRLVKSPGFTIVAVLSLGLGIGANSALFTLVNNIFLQDDGIVEPDRVVKLYWDGPTPHWSITWGWYRGVRDELDDVFSHTTAHRLVPARTEATGDAQILALRVSGDYFGTMGVQPMLGRGFEPGVETDVTSGPAVVVLSHRYWERALGAPADVIGTTLRIDAQPHEIIGVLPAGFAGKASGIGVEIFLPDHRAPANPGSDNLIGGARLAPGVSLRQARAALAALAGSINQTRPESLRAVAFTMIPESEVRVDPTIDRGAAPIAALLFAVVFLVLVIACTNLASFLLARAADRKREFAVRRAMGAGRGRVVSQLLAESLTLALVGGVVGIAIAQLSLRALLSVELPIPVVIDTSLDARIVLFTLAVTGIAGLMFGIFPALTAGREEVATTLRSDSAGVIGGRGRVGLRGALVVVQVSLSLTLLVAAGLFIRSLLAATSVDPGFEREGRAVVTVDPGSSGYSAAESQRVIGEVVREVRALPSIEQASFGSRVPLALGISRSGIRRPDQEIVPGREYRHPQVAYVGEGYLETMGVELLAGREFEAADDTASLAVVVLNRALAVEMWPDASPAEVVGRSVILSAEPESTARVVGVAETAKVASIGEEPTPYMYLPHRRYQVESAIVIARTRAGADPRVAAQEIAALAKALDPDLFVHSATTLAVATSGGLFLPRMGAILLALFGALALVMASIGLYGLVSFGVKRREKEVGIRLSLGADPGEMIRMIMGSGTRLVVIGAVIGIVLGIGSGVLLERFLFGVSGLDPLTLVVVPALLVGVAVLASWVPARRAATIDPVESLRSE